MEDKGDFWISHKECLICGACHDEASGLIDWSSPDSEGPSYNSSNFIKQPETTDEIDKVIAAMRVCMADCIYYAGNNPKTLEAISTSVDYGKDTPLKCKYEDEKLDTSKQSKTT